MTGKHTVEADLTRVIWGFAIGPVLEAACAHCDRVFEPGQHVTAYCYRSRSSDWSVAGVACRACESDEQLACPTLGAFEAQVDARLALCHSGPRQRDELALVSVDVLETSPPTESGVPARPTL